MFPEGQGLENRIVFLIFTEGYRSGHNGAVLKTVREKSHMGSNPIPSAIVPRRRLARRRGTIPKASIEPTEFSRSRKLLFHAFRTVPLSELSGVKRGVAMPPRDIASNPIPSAIAFLFRLLWGGQKPPRFHFWRKEVFMRKLSLVLLLAFLSVSLFAACSPVDSPKRCDHEWVKDGHYDDFTLIMKCTKCGETALTTDSDRMPKQFVFTGTLTVRPAGDPADARACTDETVRNLLCRGLWEWDQRSLFDPFSPESDYVFKFGEDGVEIHYYAETGVFAFLEESTDLVRILSERDRNASAVNAALEALFP